ncbi:MAG: response regulator containing a CheY-like receiver domain and an HTH DNA-binding domain [Bacteroidetes bacterium]|nr:MAG: response regulator containing a CheY-like receiver domain and an HTH DNA-binding domain [Bacteroidota bacterium]
MSISKIKLEILIADDDAEDRMLITDALRESKYKDQISQVENGEELIHFLNGKSNRRPDLILLDLNMPKKDGREALKEIKSDKRLKNIPVVVLTTSGSDDDIEKTYSLGVNSYITKPAGFHDMVDIMNTVCHYWFKISELPQNG